MPIHGVEFPVVWVDLGDSQQGEMRYEPEPGGVIQIKVHQRFKGTDYAWLVLFHEMCHAALAVSGATAQFKGQAEEATVLGLEAVWQGLVAVGRQSKKRAACRGSKGRATRARKSNPSRRRPSR